MPAPDSSTSRDAKAQASEHRRRKRLQRKKQKTQEEAMEKSAAVERFLAEWRSSVVEMLGMIPDDPWEALTLQPEYGDAF